MIDYAALLAHSYQTELDGDNPPHSCHEFLTDHVFGFTTYDTSMSEEFARRAVTVCKALQESSTFDLIRSPEQYQWYLIMCNMPFFRDRLGWGTSIRGAWWSYEPTILESCGLWSGHDQVLKTYFTRPEWLKFIAAVIEFAA